MTDLAQYSQLVTALVAVVGALAYFARKRGDALPIQAEAERSEKRADETAQNTIAEMRREIREIRDGREKDREAHTAEREKDRDDCERRLRDSENRRDRESAEWRQKIEAKQAELDQWQQTAGENLMIAVARQDYAEQLEALNRKQDRSDAKLDRVVELLDRGVGFSERMTSLLEQREARTKSEPKLRVIEFVDRAPNDGRVDR
jgi:hypothetical protein